MESRGTWAGLAGQRRFEGGVHLEAGTVRLEDGSIVAIPIGDLEQFEVSGVVTSGIERLVVVSPDPDATTRLGRALGEVAEAGDLISPVGATSGRARRISPRRSAPSWVSPRPSSPSFVLMAEYDGRLPLFHIDPYRLVGAEDALAGGLIDERQAEGVTLVEWPEQLGDALPVDRLDVHIGGTGEEPRTITLVGVGRALPTTWRPPRDRCPRRSTLGHPRHRHRHHARRRRDRLPERPGFDGISTWPAGYRRRDLLPSIGQFLGEQNIRRSRLVGIAVGTGPGAFTGLRVRIATAKGMAHGLGIR